MNMLTGKTIVLGVTGGIAAYKAAAITSKLTQLGARVRVIMTESATKLVQPLTFQALSKERVIVDTFDERDPSVVMHIDMADKADLVIIAPATANILAKMAVGIADDMLSTTLLAVRAPILVAPAMNVHMYAHPTVQHNIQVLKGRGIRFIEPGVGQLACGYEGKGRMAEPEDIVAEAVRILQEPNGVLAGKRLLVTAGSTVERIDPVRYLTNDSSGKMGIAIAEAARDMGASVTLVAGKTSVPLPGGMEVVSVVSAQEMLEEVMARLPATDIVVKAAAVADYRPATQSPVKIKKSGEEMTLTLVKNPDILQQIGEAKTTQFVVGFAAETDHLEQHAMDKLRRKRCDLIVANDVAREGAGFGVDTNIVSIFDANGLVAEWPQMTKREVAVSLLRLVAERLERAGDRT